ncbi:hypothetical protein [Paenibacillus lemnae]|uniref:Uncharacterized protein n=1 Tax=Paenibacillus lemnae TaxID=1330551 RepID=A0A848MA69_PAELE|nr:hypothetical protein [Paenibacillus lemnae]NMO97565.1 hypothetical protein [Paenibacillus lemnae]
MIKLLKYDWKRNAGSISGLLAVLMIVQVLIGSMYYTGRWDSEVSIGLSMMVYGIVSTILLIMVFKTYDYNIRAYHRRLLPVPPLSSVTATMIQASAAMILILLLAACHIWVFWSISEWSEVLQFVHVQWSHVLVMLVSGFLKFIFFVAIVLFCITVSRSFRSKGSIWIGILLFFIIQSAVSWVSNKLFGEAPLTYQILTVRLEGRNYETAAVEEVVNGFWRPMLLELILTIALVYVAVKLIDRKVEV